MADTEARWYCVNAQGLPMLCASKEDAEREAARNDKVWPKGAPHRAVQLCDAAERDRLRAQVENLRHNIHTCGPTCSKAACVNRRLRADVRELVECLGTVLATHEAEAKADLSYENALSNFDDSSREWKAYSRAMRAASDAEKAARALLAKHKETT